jgi:CheY-like chemotaxis protein
MRLPVIAGAARDVQPVASPSVSDARLDGLTVLVVDDERDSREMLAALLEARGARPILGESAESALEVLRRERPDLLIADIAMPGVDGYELLRRVRAAGIQTPAIAVTAFARSDDRTTAHEPGYTAYLSKPIDAMRLVRVARAAVRAADA